MADSRTYLRYGLAASSPRDIDCPNLPYIHAPHSGTTAILSSHIGCRSRLQY